MSMIQTEPTIIECDRCGVSCRAGYADPCDCSEPREPFEAGAMDRLMVNVEAVEVPGEA